MIEEKSKPILNAYYMNVSLTILMVFLLLLAAPVKGQHHSTKESTKEEPLSFSPVLSQMLSDPQLKEFKVESSILTLAPGATDTIAHRHDCEIFGYILEGEVLIGLDKKEPVAFGEGKMFYEKRNVLHSLTKNTNASKAAKVLLVFIIKNGRNSYIKESSK
ncbi:cupin domain-containing protein [Rhodocytophaga rosea]|uniref:Cupin domain-containing protein n=1 Tax=Rhodocytophaga rosea TaxID=2704465 RepID=A0A6C0GU74_9BACT|nr:cupin domain-containing protein [Rhodocytophaga rosea]QHT71749.1 cupin domain-containing protein [Rhodocytophaga rosea]